MSAVQNPVPIASPWYSRYPRGLNSHFTRLEHRNADERCFTKMEKVILDWFLDGHTKQFKYKSAIYQLISWVGFNIGTDLHQHYGHPVPDQSKCHPRLNDYIDLILYSNWKFDERLKFVPVTRMRHVLLPVGFNVSNTDEESDPWKFPLLYLREKFVCIFELKQFVTKNNSYL